MIENEILGKVCSRILDEQEPVINTGFSDLDTMLRGIDKSSIITIGARPAMGKTSFMTTIMLNLLEQKKKCLYFSMEMSTEQLIKRLLGQIGEIDSHLLNIAGEINHSAKSLEKLTKAIEKISEYNLTIVDGVFDIKKIKENIEKNKPEFVFIDYLQLVNVPSKKPRTESFEKLMIDLKQLAKDNNCLIFITSQLSRAVENRINKRPLLSDLRDSGAIENLSDVVIFIYREDYYSFFDVEDFERNRGQAEIIVAKNRYGFVGSVKILFRSAIMKFLEPVHHDCSF